MKRIIAIIISLLLVFVFSPQIRGEEIPEAINMLSSFGLKADITINDNPKGNCLYADPVYRVESEKGSYSLLDGNGEIKYIERYFEVKSAKNSGCLSGCFENMEDFHTLLRQSLVGSDYELVYSYMFDYRTVCEKYERKNACGGYNPYDSFTVFIDTVYNTLVLLSKSDNYYIPDIANVISQDDAVLIASEYANSEVKKDNSKLSVVNISDFRPLEKITEEFTLVYQFKTDTEYIFIDAYSGAVLFVDPLKIVYGGAVAVPDFYSSDAILSVVQTAMQNLGYNMTLTIKTAYLHVNVPYYLNEGFYISSHGNSTELTSRQTGVSDVDRKFNTSQVNQNINYKLVFLDACSTASASSWSDAFNIYSTSSGKAFLGWTTTVGITESYIYNLQLWPQIHITGSVGLAAAQAVSYASPYYCPISFTGDYSFNGYHY